MHEILHELRLVVYPNIYTVNPTSQVVVWDFFHEQYDIICIKPRLIGIFGDLLFHAHVQVFMYPSLGPKITRKPGGLKIVVFETPGRIVYLELFGRVLGGSW